MTIGEAFALIEDQKPSGYTANQMREWLNYLDAMIYREIVKTHEWETEPEFTPYTADTPDTTELLIDDNFSDIYIAWLSARIDFADGEFSRYNSSSTLYNSLYADYAGYINRTHMPKGTKGAKI